ncbi:MAG: AAA family ATPase [Patescibacteria group bacterium]
MFLKSLELNGFKSFVQKTILEFPDGITAIVGPNGSGKSNIIDAIRWLLGERESKNLRSAKAEDLIFNGTPSKPRVAMASAGLCFDNNTGFFPIDFKEVSIVRRVGRDGLSQYLINKSEVKLKEIIDFFSRSRLGTKGLTIINQGEADLFVKASSGERQTMIEEILGLREYQNKKIEAERKMKNTSINLEKAKAMKEEVIPRLRTLKRQTNKWEKRTEIQKELNDIENRYFFYKFNEIEDGRKKFEPLLDSLDNQIKEKEREIKILKLELNKVESQTGERQEIRQIKNQQQQLSAECSQIQKEFGRIEAKLEFLEAPKASGGKIFRNEDLLVLVREAGEILNDSLSRSDLEYFKKIIKELAEKIDKFLNPVRNNFNQRGAISNGVNLEKDLADLENLKKSLEVKFSIIEDESKKLEAQEMKIAIGLEEFNKKFQAAFESVELKRKELRALEENKNKILFEKEKLNLKFQDLENQLRQIGRNIAEFEFGELILNPQSSILNPQFDDIERKMFKLRAELSAIGEIDEALIKEAQEVETHYNFLINQSQDLEKAIIDLKNLIKELNEKINFEFNSSLKLINEEFNKFFKLMFGGGNARLRIKDRELRIKGVDDNEIEEKNNEDEQKEILAGLEIDLNLPKKRITSLETLSGGEKSLVSIAALFALISISPPPFLVLDEIDAALDENNSGRFANLIKEFSAKTQFIVVTHNRAVMETANALYGITTGEDGTSKVLSLKLE